MWRCPKIGLPQNHPNHPAIRLGFCLKEKKQLLGSTRDYGTPLFFWATSWTHIVYVLGIDSHRHVEWDLPRLATEFHALCILWMKIRVFFWTLSVTHAVHQKWILPVKWGHVIRRFQVFVHPKSVRTRRVAVHVDHQIRKEFNVGKPERKTIGKYGQITFLTAKSHISRSIDWMGRN